MDMEDLGIHLSSSYSDVAPIMQQDFAYSKHGVQFRSFTTTTYKIKLKVPSYEIVFRFSVNSKVSWQLVSTKRGE